LWLADGGALVSLLDPLRHLPLRVWLSSRVESPPRKVKHRKLGIISDSNLFREVKKKKN
jgi:hypothetical protein